MRRWLLTCGLLATLSFSASTSQADIKVEPPRVEAPLVLKSDPKAKTHRIIIPRQLLKGIEVSQLDLNGAESEASFASTFTGDNGRTILAGCALSMAAGSVVFLRRRQVTAAVVLVGATLALGAGSIGWADFAPEPKKQNVILEIADKGDSVVFISPGK